MTHGTYWQRLLLETARDCSALGSAPFIVLVSAVMAPFDWTLAARLALGLASVEVCGNAVKFFFHRERPERQPYGNVLERLDAASFPSIHTARAAMVAAAAGASAGWVLLWTAVTIVVGVSRLALKRHHVSDVLAGCLLGLIAGSLMRG